MGPDPVPETSRINHSLTCPDGRQTTFEEATVTYSINRIERGTTRLTQQRYERLKPFFLNASKKVVENTINATTQYANDLLAGPTIKNAHRSRNPACKKQSTKNTTSLLLALWLEQQRNPCSVRQDY